MSELTNATAFWLVDVHLLAGALLAIALPAVLLLRQPAQRMAVAKAVLAALVALAILCALPGWSVVHLLSADSQPTPLATQQRPLGPALAPQPVDRLIPHISNNQVPTSASPPVSTVATAPLAIELAPRGSFWPLAVVILQAAGSALIVLWLIAGAYAAHRLRRGADPAPTELTHLLAKFTGNARPTALLLSASIAMPVALGLRRPAIILPRPSGEGQGEGEPSPRLTSHTALPAILAHEYAHIAAGDLRTLAVTRLLLVLFWPQPLFWLLRRRIRFDQESLADVAAADVAGRLCYAEQLVGWARMAPTRGPRLAGAIGLWEGPSQLKRRIATLLDEQITIIRHTSRRWRMGTAGAALILASLLSLVTLQREDAAAQDTQTPAAAPNAALASEPTDSQRTEEESETTHTTVGVGQNGLAAVGIAGEAAYEGANTISVRCIDEAGAPLEGVEATLYRVWYRDGKHERVAMSTSGSNGEATFMNVVPVDRVEQYNAMLTARQHQDLFATHILVVTGRVGLATALVSAAEYEVGRQGYAAEVTLGPGQKLAGRVIAPDGSPVAGALVAAGAMANVTIDGVNAVRTDADGRYEFDDRPRYEAAAAREQRPRINSFSYTAGDESEGTGYRSTRPKRQPVPADLWASQLTISHPDYAVTRAPGGDIPGRVDVRMQPAAAIAGRVKTIAGAPAADMLVRAYSHSDMEIADEGSVVRRTGDFTLAHGGGHAAAARTNADGAYRMTSLPEGVYDVWVETTTTGDPRSGLTNTGIAELTVPASSGATVAPDLVVGPGVLLRGQILDGATGGPLRLPNGARATVIPNYVGGPRMQDQPSSEVIVTADGKFEARMAPGKAHLTVLVVVLGREAEHSPRPEFVTSDDTFGRGMIVEAAHGDEIQVTIPVWPSAEIIKRREARRVPLEMFSAKKWQEAADAFSRLLEQTPDDVSALLARAMCYDKLGEVQKAAADYEQVLKLDPNEVNSLQRQSSLLATGNDEKMRDGQRAIELATRLIARVREERYQQMLPESLALLAAAHAEAGDFTSAVKAQTEAIGLAPAKAQEELKARLRLYESGQPYRRE